MNINESIFKSYDVRGTYPDQLNEHAAQVIAGAYLNILFKRVNKSINKLRVVVGRDIRLSSDVLMKAVVETFINAGVNVDDVGLVSINDIYYLVGQYHYDGGIMATASHNPPQYGGLKMVSQDNTHKKSLKFISGLEILEEIKKFDHQKTDNKRGQLVEKDFIKEFSFDYLKHIFSFVDIKKIKPLKVIVDTGNGMTGLMVPGIFSKLPCQMTHLFPDLDGNFPNHPPNPLEPGAIDHASKKVLSEKADLGVAFDADGDRIFLINERGELVRGDMVLLLIAKTMLKNYPGSGVAYNLICSHAVRDLIKKWGGKPIRSEVGYKNLARHMQEEGGIMSGEVSAHFAFRDNFYTDSGFIAMVVALQTICEDGRPLSSIIKDFSLYVKNDELNLKVDNISDKLQAIRNKYKDNIFDEIDGITVEFSDWWFNVRPSNTEPLLRVTVEANSASILKKRQAEVIDVINKT